VCSECRRGSDEVWGEGVEEDGHECGYRWSGTDVRGRRGPTLPRTRPAHLSPRVLTENVANANFIM